MLTDRVASDVYFEDGDRLTLARALAAVPHVTMRPIRAVVLGISTTLSTFSDPWKDEDRTSIHSYSNTRRKHGRRLTLRQAYTLVMNLQARAEAEIREERIAEWERSVSELADK